MKKYRPSNGTEGEAFMDHFCYKCINLDPNPDGKRQCEILMRSMCHNIHDPAYPSEWCYDDYNHPVCTAWRKWDWGNDGDPDDPDNPRAPIPENPNQLCFPFIFDELEINFNNNDTIKNQPERTKYNEFSIGN